MYTPHFSQYFQQAFSLLRIIPFVLILAGINFLFQKTKDKGALIMVIGTIIITFPFLFFLFHSLNIISNFFYEVPYILFTIMIHISITGRIVIGIGLIIFAKNFIQKENQTINFR